MLQHTELQIEPDLVINVHHCAAPTPLALIFVYLLYSVLCDKSATN